MPADHPTIPGVTFRIAEVLTAQERKPLYDWGDDIFESRGMTIEWRPKDLHLIVERDGMPVSHVGLLKHEITVSGQALTVGGIGSVVTRGDCHRQGFATYALAQAVSYLKGELHVPFGVLFCRDAMVPFYEKQGWQLIQSPVLVEQSDRPPMVMPANIMSLSLTGMRWPDGEVTLNSLPW